MKSITIGAVAMTLTALTACSDDSADDDGSVEERFGDAPATIGRDVSVDECGFTQSTGGGPYAAGTVTNSHDETLTYIIDVEIDVSIDNPGWPGATDRTVRSRANLGRVSERRRGGAG